VTRGALATSGMIDSRASEGYKWRSVPRRPWPSSTRSLSESAPSTSADFRVFAERFCKEAVERDLIEGASSGENQAEIEALEKDVVEDLLRSGEIERLERGAPLDDSLAALGFWRPFGAGGLRRWPTPSHPCRNQSDIPTGR
jgi:hypothetical protein